MTQFKKFFATALLAVCVASPVLAQESAEEGKDYKPYPYMFVGIQGGAQTTLTNYSFSKLITPTASVSFGSFFTPVIGARLHVNGAWNKGALKNEGGQFADQKYHYNYITTDLDLMVNLVTLFGKKDYYPVNLYLIGGIGLNTAWNNDDAYAMKEVMPFAWTGKRLSHNGRIGAQVDYNLCKNLSLNLEVDANSLSDRYNSKIADNDDWQWTAQLGLAFKFGYKKPKVVEPVEEWATRIDTIWYDDVTYNDVPKDRDFKKEIFFGICEDGVTKDQEQIAATADFLKNVTNGEITITAYADKGTGNPEINMQYSKQRAEKTKQALIDNGVDESMIKVVEWKGDTVQPYEENDMNRVSIITGHGTFMEKEKVTTKKFRTEEVRYRVN